jgi:hypothetical protein
MNTYMWRAALVHTAGSNIPAAYSTHCALIRTTGMEWRITGGVGIRGQEWDTWGRARTRRARRRAALRTCERLYMRARKRSQARTESLGCALTVTLINTAGINTVTAEPPYISDHIQKIAENGNQAIPVPAWPSLGPNGGRAVQHESELSRVATQMTIIIIMIIGYRVAVGCSSDDHDMMMIR